MSVRLLQEAKQGGIYFITFTCFRWKPLIELTNTYDAVYKWFDDLRAKKACVIGYG